MNGFQLTVISIFVVALIVGVLIFAGVLPGFRAPEGGLGGKVVWWGTILSDDLQEVLEKVRTDHRGEFTLEYVEKSPETLEADLLEAIALGRGPDLITLTSDVLLRQTAKLQPIPYEVYSKQDFKNTFVLGTHIREWELFFDQAGVVGLPLYVDPLVLFYNQDLIANAKVASLPKTWNGLANTIKLLIQADSAGNLNQAAIALGTVNNISNAKDLLAFLMLQASNPIVMREDGRAAVTLKDNFGFNKQPAGEAIGFFLRFSDPANTLYGWNTSQPEARDAFLRGKLAMYLGWGSEIRRLALQNPQLNFYLALPPQRDNVSGREVTLGRFSFLAIPRGAANPNTALQVASILSGPAISKLVAEAVNLPPARNDLLAAVPSDPDLAVLYQAAVIARDWLDPAPDKTNEIFRQMVESIAVGRTDAGRAINDADVQLENLLPSYETAL